MRLCNVYSRHPDTGLLDGNAACIVEKALYGNQRVTLEEFVAYEGKTKRDDVGPNGQKGWSIQPLCPDCGATVHPYIPKKVAAAFKTSGEEVGQKAKGKAGKKSNAVPHFDHDDRVARVDCPSFHARKPHLATLYDNLTFDFRERSRNESVLLLPDVMAQNQKILESLMRDLTGLPYMSAEDQYKLDQIAQTRLHTMVGLAQYPWALPVMQVLLFGAHERKARSGRVSTAAYSAGALEHLPLTYLGASLPPGAKAPTLAVPKTLYLCFADKYGHIKKPMRYGRDGPLMSTDVMKIWPRDRVLLSRKFSALAQDAQAAKVMPPVVVHQAREVFEKKVPLPKENMALPMGTVENRSVDKTPVEKVSGEKLSVQGASTEIFRLIPVTSAPPPKRAAVTKQKRKKTAADPRQVPLFK